MENAKLKKIKEMVDARTPSHGDFGWVATTAQLLKNQLHSSPDWEGNLSPKEREAIEMICTKLARWLHGNDGEGRIDTKKDIIGYVLLTLEDK